jgi:hypothetical protein
MIKPASFKEIPGSKIRMSHDVHLDTGSSYFDNVLRLDHDPFDMKQTT